MPKLKTLKELDKRQLTEVDKILNKKEVEATTEHVEPKCKKCQDSLERVIPLIEMGTLVLYECVGCHEREYL